MLVRRWGVQSSKSLAKLLSRLTFLEVNSWKMSLVFGSGASLFCVRPDLVALKDFQVTGKMNHQGSNRSKGGKTHKQRKPFSFSQVLQLERKKANHRYYPTWNLEAGLFPMLDLSPSYIIIGSAAQREGQRGILEYWYIEILETSWVPGNIRPSFNF